MSVTIVATVGSASANSFITEVEVIAYMDARLNASTWTTVSGTTCIEDEKTAMVEATRELSARHWAGLRVDTTQVLSWPRQWACNPDSPTGDYYTTTEIPQRVKDACCELAFQFLKLGTTDLAAEDALQGVTQSTIDVISKSYDANLKTQGLARFPRVWNLIAPLLEGSGFTVRTVRS